MRDVNINFVLLVHNKTVMKIKVVIFIVVLFMYLKAIVFISSYNSFISFL